MTGPAGFRLETALGLTVVRSVALLEIPGVGHVFSTRRGPDGADFDLSADAAGRPASGERLSRLCEAVGLAAEGLVSLRQVHGAEVQDLDSGVGETAPAQADAVTARRAAGRAVAVRTADCVPLLLAQAEGLAVAAVHAGWRGITRGIVSRAVLALERAGHAPALLRAVLGPAIGGCCYEVGRDVLDDVARGVGVGASELNCGTAARPHLDLRAVARWQLEAAGVQPGAIEAAPWCTSCSRTLFYSHRREGGAAGRQLACIGWGAKAEG